MTKNVLIPAKYRRAKLKLKDFACVIDGVATYPLKPKKRALNAMARYHQTATATCKGGLKKICKAYKKYGLTHTDAYRQKCRI
jgi:hypothetical protein